MSLPYILAIPAKSLTPLGQKEINPIATFNPCQQNTLLAHASHTFLHPQFITAKHTSETLTKISHHIETITKISHLYSTLIQNPAHISPSHSKPNKNLSQNQSIFVDYSKNKTNSLSIHTDLPYTKYHP